MFVEIIDEILHEMYLLPTVYISIRILLDPTVLKNEAKNQMVIIRAFQVVDEIINPHDQMRLLWVLVSHDKRLIAHKVKL